MMSARGFTLVEVLLVMGIVAVIFSFSSISVFETISNDKINSTRNILISDMQSQQLKAMNGETWQANQAYWGITIQSDKYILTPQNQEVLMNGLTLNNDFTNSKILYATSSGEVNTIAGEESSVTVADPKGRNEIIKLNKYGKLVD